MSTLYLKLSNDWQKHFFLYVSIAIIVSTCSGGLAVFSIFQHGTVVLQMIQLFLVVVLCTGVLASILTVQKPKVVLNTLIASLVSCFLIVVYNFIF